MMQLACRDYRPINAWRGSRYSSLRQGEDDRLPDVSRIDPVSFVIIEGWCVGACAEPLSRLAVPLNRLEREEDSTGDWRHWVNDALGSAPPKTQSGGFHDLSPTFRL